MDTKPFLERHGFSSRFEEGVGGAAATLTIIVRTAVKALPTTYLWDDKKAKVYDERDRSAPDHCWRPVPLQPPEMLNEIRLGVRHSVQESLSGAFIVRVGRVANVRPSLRRVECRLEIRLVDDWADNHCGVLVFNAVDGERRPQKVRAAARSATNSIFGRVDNPGVQFPFDWDIVIAPEEIAPADRSSHHVDVLKPFVGVTIVHEMLHHLGVGHAGEIYAHHDEARYGACGPYGRGTLANNNQLCPDVFMDVMGAGDRLASHHAWPWMSALVDHHVLPSKAFATVPVELKRGTAIGVRTTWAPNQCRQCNALHAPTSAPAPAPARRDLLPPSTEEPSAPVAEPALWPDADRLHKRGTRRPWG